MTAIPAQDVHGTLQLPYLPAGIGTSVLAILGLTNYAPFSDDLTHTPQGVTSSDSTAPTATYTGNLKPSDFASAYDLGPLQAAGIRGQGETLGIVTLAGFDPGTAYHFWRRVLHIATKHDRITVVNVDGGPGAPSEAAGSGESDLDVEQSGAPQLNGSAALIDQYVGHRVGLWNPVIYSFAASADSPFTPLDAAGASNDNLYYTGTPGQIYNAGSGLGYPDLAMLAGDFRG
jgi:subtilase family serine protease